MGSDQDTIDELEPASTLGPPLKPPTGADAALASSPAGALLAYLVVVAAPDVGTILGKRYVVGAGVSVGSGQRDDVLLAVEGVVQGHARVLIRGNSVELTATNGPIVVANGGERRHVGIGESSDLVSFDEITIGRARLRVLAAAAVTALQHLYHACIYELTIRDGATGLHNKRWLYAALEREAEHARRVGSHLSVVTVHLVDGEPGGSPGGSWDEIFALGARQLAAATHDGETTARLGRDEFAVIIPGASPVEAEARAATLLSALQTALGSAKATSTLAVGMASLDPSDRSPADLLARASLARSEPRSA